MAVDYQFSTNLVPLVAAPAFVPLITPWLPLSPPAGYIRSALHITPRYISLSALSFRTALHLAPRRLSFHPSKKKIIKKKKRSLTHQLGEAQLKKITSSLDTRASVKKPRSSKFSKRYRNLVSSHLIDHVRIGSFEEEGIRVKSPLESKVLVFRELTSRQRDARNARKTTRRDQTVDAYGISDLKTLCCFR